MPNTQLPNLIVIGAQKCGTSSLHYNLNLHPEIGMSREKELNYFSGKAAWEKGPEWYCRQFPTGTRWRGESSPEYSNAIDDSIAKRMHGCIPGARLIYIVRHPVDRIVSQYIHFVSIGIEARKINDALGDFTDNSYIRKTRYYSQLSLYLRHYPESQIHVLTLDSLRSDPAGAMGDIFRFLGVDDRFWSSEFTVARHKSSHKGRKNRVGLLLKRLSDSKPARLVSTDARMKLGRLMYAPFSKKMERPAIDPELRKQLLDYLEEDTLKLQQFTGLDLSSWLK